MSQRCHVLETQEGTQVGSAPGTMAALTRHGEGEAL